MASASESPLTRQRELDDTPDGRSPKRTKLDDEPLSNDHKNLDSSTSLLSKPEETVTAESNENLLPPSHVLLGTSKPEVAPGGAMYRILETDVGISEYIASDVPKISGIIKQRYGI